MTKKKSSKSSKKHPFNRFVNFYLTRFDKEEVNKVFSNKDLSLLDWLEEMTEDGYAFKFTYDDYNDCRAVMMIGETTKEFNQGCIMSGRHNNFYKALAIVYYQHTVMSNGEHWDTVDEELPEHDW